MENFSLLPGDILREIGLLLDWKTIFLNYRCLSRRFYEICDEKFWLEKLNREYGDSPRSKLYQESFYHYLAEKSRRLQVELPKNLAKKTRENFKQLVLKLSPIQRILFRKLKSTYPQSFKLHREDMEREEYLKMMSKRGKFNLYDLYLNFEINPDLGPHHQVITISIFTDRDGEVNMSHNEDPPLVFYEFVWELGLSLPTVGELYGYEYSFRGRGPYNVEREVRNDTMGMVVPEISRNVISS